ncbi:MAG: FkbM family methyltransferase [Bacillota bacterium]
MDSRIIDKHKAEFLVNNTPRYKRFWDNFESWEKDTFKIYDRFLSQKSSYLDVGAWIGPTVLYAAHKTKHVYAIEPDPIAYQELIGNLSLNPSILSNVTCINAALSSDTLGKANLYKKYNFGDACSSIIPTKLEKDFCQVTKITIEGLIEKYNLKDLNFVKIDIEGYEYFIIAALHKFLKKYQPTLYLSLHPLILNVAADLHSNDTDHNVKIDKFKLTKRLVETLDFYSYIYDSKGNLVNKDLILNLNNNDMFLFTNDPY